MPYLLFAQKKKLNYIKLEKDFMLTMGHTPDCNIVLPPSASSHFRIFSWTEDSWVLETLGDSPENTRRFIPLGNDDKIELGPLTITFLDSIEGYDAKPFEGTIALSTDQKIGKYTILNLLNRTQWGSLYLANDENEQAYALKVFNKELTQEETDAFYEQFRLISNLSAHGITPYHAYGIFHRKAYYVTDYCPHTNLDFRISAKAPMEQGEALGIIRNIAEILRLAQLETGNFHGGLEPSIILYNSNERIRITEFGIFLWKSMVLNEGCAAISPWYISPEEIEGGEVSFLSDIYSLGVIFFQMLTGVLPFYSEDKEQLYDMHLHSQFPLPSDRNPNVRVSQHVLRLLLKMTARDPADRFRSWDELLAAAADAAQEKYQSPQQDDAQSSPVEASTMNLRSSLLKTRSN